MTLDLDALLASFGDDAPSGEDLEYDPDFIALELAAMPKDEHQVGDQVIAGEEPDFKEVKDAAVTVMKRAHDLRAAVFYAQASLRLDGIAGLEESLVYIRRCLEEYWDSVHPQLDPDDDNDPTARMNAIAGLADNDTVIRALRLAPLTSSRGFGRFSLRDIQMAKGEIQPPKGEEAPEAGVISAAFQDTPIDDTRALAASITACRESLKALQKVLDDKVAAQGPDLDPLNRTLYEMEQSFKQYAGDLLAEPEPEEEEPGEAAPVAGGEADGGDGAAQPAAAQAAAAPRGVGTISTRKDVLTALDRICDYYAKNEPTSPVPLILERAKRLVTADFVTIIRDLAPDGLDRVRLITGVEEE